MDDEPKVQHLENRIDSLESTIEKMMPSRRDALKMGGAALVGGAAMSGTASAGTNQVGTIGSQASPVDLESEDINNADTVTTENLVVNNTATGPFGGGGAPVLEAGDTITVKTIHNNFSFDFVELYNGPPKDVLGGVVQTFRTSDFLYEFSNNQTLTKNTGVGSTANVDGNQNNGKDENRDDSQIDFLPPALDVIRIEIGSEINQRYGAEVILKD